MPRSTVLRWQRLHSAMVAATRTRSGVTVRRRWNHRIGRISNRREPNWRAAPKSRERRKPTGRAVTGATKRTTREVSAKARTRVCVCKGPEDAGTLNLVPSSCYLLPTRTRTTGSVGVRGAAEQSDGHGDMQIIGEWRSEPERKGTIRMLHSPQQASSNANEIILNGAVWYGKLSECSIIYKSNL